MPLFGQKRGPQPAAQPQTGGNTLIDNVVAMQQQGYSDDDIVVQLQSQGVPPEQIQDAMSQAGMMAGGPLPPEMAGIDSGYPPQHAMPPGPAPAPQGMGMGGQMQGREQIEEVAESIIQEKWNDLLKDLTKLNEWKTKAETSIAKIESDVDNLKETFDNLHKGVLGKIGEYDKNLSMVGTEIKAMEKVFQKVLPTFTDNVNKLERLTKRASVKK